jgi:hypothetical protein
MLGRAFLGRCTSSDVLSRPPSIIGTYLGDLIGRGARSNALR